MDNMFYGVIVDSDSVNYNAVRMTTGDIYFSTLYGDFPTTNWNDFVVRLLANWMETLVSFQNPKLKTINLQFMEGRYEVILTKSNELEYILSFCYGKQNIIPDCTCDIKLLYYTIVSNVNGIIGKFKSEDTVNDEIVYLEKLNNIFVKYYY